MLSPSVISPEYVLRVQRCGDGFTATLREAPTGSGPVATGVAPTPAQAMVAAIANARISDTPMPDARMPSEFDPPTL
jgi:hypothetical protein